LGLSIRVSMFEHVDWWLGPLPRSPGMGEGGDWWSWPMGDIAKGILRGCQGLFTPVSLGYPLSVFNKNSTLKADRSATWPASVQHSQIVTHCVCVNIQLIFNPWWIFYPGNRLMCTNKTRFAGVVMGPQPIFLTKNLFSFVSVRMTILPFFLSAD